MMHFFDKLEVLGRNYAESTSEEEKLAFRFAMDAIYFILGTGQGTELEAYVQSQDASAPPLVIARFKTTGNWYVPTISAGRYVADKARTPGYYSDLVRPKAAAIGPQLQATFARAHKAGV